METKEFKSRPSMIFFFLEGCKKYFITAIIFACGLVLFELVNPKIIGYTVDFIIGDIESIPAFLLDWIQALGGREYVMGHLWIFSIVVIAIALVGAVTRYCFALFNSMGAEHLVKRMRNCLYEQITHLPYSWQDANKTGDIIQRCTSDVDMIKNFISNQMTTLFRMILMIVLALFFMFRIHRVLTLVAFAFLPAVIVYSWFFHKGIGDAFEKVDSEEGRLSAIAQENLTGVRVVRAFGREAYERDRFETKNEEYTGLWVHMMKILSSFWAINDLIYGAQILTIVSLGAYFAVKGQMSAGNYVAFISFNGLLTFPVRQLGRVVSEMSKAGISIDRLMYIMNSAVEKDAQNAVDFPGNGDIVFDNVNFAYDTEEVLKGVSFTIKKGQTIGILGGTGSGKSTLIHVLDGLYELGNDGGSITINGVDIRNIKKSELRSHIGIVLQEPYLFSRSIEDNIKLANDGAGHSDVEAVVRTASLDSSINKFADGYDTYVGERGVTLSGGQKQRTAIAQMLIRNTDIMIFDDSLSAVDAETDARIRHALKNMDKGRERTMILISHRITTLMQADNIFVLEDGRITESGNHEELLENNGIYSEIYKLQVSQGEEAI